MHICLSDEEEIHHKYLSGVMSRQQTNIPKSNVNSPMSKIAEKYYEKLKHKVVNK